MLLCLILILLDNTHSQHPDCGSVVKTGTSCLPNYILNGATNLLSVKTSSHRKCVSTCMQKTGCKSVNFNIKTRQCDLLDSSWMNLAGQSFVQSSDSYYCEIQTKVRFSLIYALCLSRVTNLVPNSFLMQCIPIAINLALCRVFYNE